MRQSAIRAWLYAGAILAGVGVAVLAVSRRPRVKAGERVLVVGDSMAEALGPYLKTLGKDDGIEVLSLHKRGSRIDAWREAPKFLAAMALKPDLVVFVLGTNDQVGAHGQSAAEAAALASKAKGFGSRIVWIGPPTLTENDLADELQRVFGAEYFDSRKLDIPRGADGLHPSVSGAAGWAGTFWEWLH